METARKHGRTLVATAVLCAALFAPTASASEVERTPEGQPYLPGKLLVRFEPGISSGESRAVARELGARVEERIEGVPNLRLIDLPPGTGVRSADSRFSSRDEVRFAEPNFLYRISQQQFPNEDTMDPANFSRLWGLHNPGGPPINGTPDADIDAPEAWFDQTGSDTVRVAVIDSGIATLHPDLANNLWQNPGESGGTPGSDDDMNGKIDDVNGWDFVEEDETPDDENSHGTHVAGTIGAVGNNSTGVVGVNWDVSLMALKAGDADGFLSVADVVEAVAYANSEGADVVNMSFGGSGGSSSYTAAIAASPDLLFVAAAGNSGTNLDALDDNSFPCEVNQPNVICVGATRPNDALASFSSFGKATVDLAAPGAARLDSMGQGVTGTNILSTVPTFIIEPGNDFDFEPAGEFLATWTVGGVNGSWAETTSQFFSPTHAIRTTPATYLPNADFTAKPTAPVDLTGNVDCRVVMNLDYEIATGDELLLEGSPDGTTWTEIDSWAGDDFEQPAVRAIPDEFEGISTFHVRLHFVSNGSGQDAGAVVDDFKVDCADPTAAKYDFKSGTSMAAPHVTGAAALVLAENAAYGPAQLRAALLNNVDQIGSLGCLVASGGRLNVDRAIQPGAEVAPAPPNNCPAPPQTASEEEPRRCSGKRATIVGTGGRDKIKGTNGADVIAAGAGADTVRGRGGKDTICGEGGKDRLFGGPGKDTLVGGPAKDLQVQ